MLTVFNFTDSSTVLFDTLTYYNGIYCMITSLFRSDNMGQFFGK